MVFRRKNHDVVGRLSVELYLKSGNDAICGQRTTTNVATCVLRRARLLVNVHAVNWLPPSHPDYQLCLVYGKSYANKSALAFQMS